MAAMKMVVVIIVVD